ncbi:CAP domain-containing protein [Algibacter pectinivorans]|uniref:Cysteine-rich secretory protein family protein n=1 Tax=Algibacter pectinivorans TaxID=870482 RepID=A0A1I1P3P8_9FLAO|nr:CAP domain-containing protein [Algibacter pectinivorans]SFD04447.1 Cysteine-rich secretory protein family protein [Algibacter pectinivorans]
MKKLSFVFVIIVLNISFQSCSVKDDAEILEPYNSTHIQLEYSQMDYEIAEIINNYRASRSLSKLNILVEASKEAYLHNLYMVEKGEASHDYFFERLENLKKNVNAKSVSENVGYGYSSAQSVVNAWLKSENHRKNIETPEFTDLGISSTEDGNGRRYFTNIFVKR